MFSILVITAIATSLLPTHVSAYCTNFTYFDVNPGGGETTAQIISEAMTCGEDDTICEGYDWLGPYCTVWANDTNSRVFAKSTVNITEGTNIDPQPLLDLVNATTYIVANYSFPMSAMLRPGAIAAMAFIPLMTCYSGTLTGCEKDGPIKDDTAVKMCFPTKPADRNAQGGINGRVREYYLSPQDAKAYKTNPALKVDPEDPSTAVELPEDDAARNMYSSWNDYCPNDRVVSTTPTPLPDNAAEQIVPPFALYPILAIVVAAFFSSL